MLIKKKTRNKHIYVCSRTEIICMISPYQIHKDFNGDTTYAPEEKKKKKNSLKS